MLLGPVSALNDPAQAPLLARTRAAWHAYAQVRQQLKQRSVSIRARVQLLDSVVLPWLMWGLESVDLSGLQRRQLGGIQRTVVSHMPMFGRRATETIVHLCNRRQRLTTTAISTKTRGQWSRLKRYRFRLDVATHAPPSGRHARIVFRCPLPPHGIDTSKSRRPGGCCDGARLQRRERMRCNRLVLLDRGQC